MIFVGDIALPYCRAIKFRDFPDFLNTTQWFGNLEGSIVGAVSNLENQYVVFNDREAIKALRNDLNFVGLALANNHIFDIGSFDETVNFLKKNEIPYVGIGKNKEEASQPLVLKDGDAEIVILNFGWKVIQCEVARGDRRGVNRLTKSHVLKQVEITLQAYPNASVIPFMHWSYELEAEPQPFERELAKKMIDLGVSGVIGCHPHRIGGYETYKGRPIVYSLGNWMFKQNYYHAGKLQFPDFCNNELALEWDFKRSKILFHFFEYCKDQSTLHYLRTEDEDSETMALLTPFRGLSRREYKRWYKANHYHRNKGLPIYYWNDSSSIVMLKNRINKVRDFFISMLSKLR